MQTQDELVTVLERKRAFEGIWLLTFVAAFVALAVPWYQRILDVDAAPVAWGLFALAAVFLAVGFATDRCSSRRVLVWVTGAQQLLGVLGLAVVWHLSGGIDHPLFLLVFCLPVVAAGAAPDRRQAVFVALAALLAVFATAWSESPELRRFALQLGLPAGGLAAVTPALERVAAPEFELPPSRVFLGLSSFAVLLLALAASTQALAARAGRPEGAAGEVAAAVLEAAPEPTAVVEPRRGLVVAASRSFVDRWLVDDGDLAGRGILELAGIRDRARVQALLASDAPGEARVLCRIGPEERRTRLVTYPIDEGRRVVVRLEDVSAEADLETAVADLSEPLLVVDASGRLAYGNRAAEELLGELYRGLPAAEVLAAEAAAGDWWRLEGDEAAAGRVTLAGRDLDWRAVAAGGDSEASRFTVVRLSRRG